MMFWTNHCVLVKLPLVFIPEKKAPLARKAQKKNCVKYLTIVVNCLHAVKIHEILMKKCISQILLEFLVYFRNLVTFYM